MTTELKMTKYQITERDMPEIVELTLEGVKHIYQLMGDIYVGKGICLVEYREIPGMVTDEEAKA